MSTNDLYGDVLRLSSFPLEDDMLSTAQRQGLAESWRWLCTRWWSRRCTDVCALALLQTLAWHTPRQLMLGAGGSSDRAETSQRIDGGSAATSSHCSMDDRFARAARRPDAKQIVSRVREARIWDRQAMQALRGRINDHLITE
jgi:hypothetical protein